MEAILRELHIAIRPLLHTEALAQARTMEIIGHGYVYEARFGSWLRLQKKVYGDDTRIEA